MTPPPRPKLRPIEAIPFSSGDDEFFLLRDPSGLAPDAQVPAELAPILALFDGTRAVPIIVEELAARGWATVTRKEVEALIHQADENLLLESPRFERHRRQMFRDFEDSPKRPPAFAGAAYPREASALQKYLDGLMQQAEALAPLPDFAPESGRGVVVPHIDLRRGGVVEALAYRELERQAQPRGFDTLVVLGIAHSGVHYPFCGALKDYDTPLGASPCDREFLESLRQRVGDRMLAETWAHKNEHSIEFVAAFLRGVESLKNTRIVPILCGGFFRETRTGESPSQTPDVTEFCQALREVVQEREAKGERIGFVASVDLAHVGSRFGDDTRLTPARLQAIARDDREFLRLGEAGDEEALHLHIARDDNARHIDAHPALYTLLHAFPNLRASFLFYDQAYDEEANSLVSFASMALREN